MNWNQGFTAAYYVATINQSTWREDGTLQIIDGSVKREASDLMESAEFTCSDYDGAERFVRIYMDVKQSGWSEHVPVFTGLATSPGRDIDGRRETNRVECYSVLKPCADVLLERGYYIPADLPLNNVIKTLLGYTPAPLADIDGEIPALTSAIIAEDDETALSMTMKALKATGWRLRIDGDGTLQVAPKDKEVVAAFDSIEYDAIEPKVTVDRDWYSLPNVFRAISENLTAVARDDDQNSPLSVQNRGREIWEQEDNIELGDNESIGEYALRRLKEIQNAATTISYTRRYHPDIRPGDTIRLHYPAQRIDGRFIVSSQSVTLGPGAPTAEEVKNEGGQQDEIDE